MNILTKGFASNKSVCVMHASTSKHTIVSFSNLAPDGERVGILDQLLGNDVSMRQRSIETFRLRPRQTLVLGLILEKNCSFQDLCTCVSLKLEFMADPCPWPDSGWKCNFMDPDMCVSWRAACRCPEHAQNSSLHWCHIRKAHHAMHPVLRYVMMA